MLPIQEVVRGLRDQREITTRRVRASSAEPSALAYFRSSYSGFARILKPIYGLGSTKGLQLVGLATSRMANVFWVIGTRADSMYSSPSEL